MQLRRHKDIIAIRDGSHPPVAFHARNLEVAAVSNALWESMAPTSFDNGFEMQMLPTEDGVVLEAYSELEAWQDEINPNLTTKEFSSGINSLTLNVTQLCNLHCTYCAAGGDGTYGDPVAKISVEKTLPQIQYFLSRAKADQNFHITFLGGEPLLYPDAIRLIASYANQLAELKNINLRFSVITNATLISEGILDILTAIRANVIVSIDGPPETHDVARPQKNGKGSSTAALAGLKLLLKKKQFLGKISLHAVFSRSNLEVVKAYVFFQKFDVDSYEFTFDVTESDRSVSSQFMIEMSKVASMAFQNGGEKSLRKISLFDSYFQSLDEQQRTENYCGSGKSLLSIDSKNKIYACPLDVGQKGMQVGDLQTLDSTKLEGLQNNLIELNNCESCWARYLCGGGCLFAHKSMTGQKHKKHVSFCERSRFLISLALVYYEQSRAMKGQI